jgi:hypothetical protein
MATHIPTPYTFDDRNWRGEKDAGGTHFVTGSGYYAHDEACTCECDGHLEECDCTEGCCWVGTAVCIVPGNPTAGDIPRATAEFICRACNAHDGLLSACKAAMASNPMMTGKAQITIDVDAWDAIRAAIAKVEVPQS